MKNLLIVILSVCLIIGFYACNSCKKKKTDFSPKVDKKEIKKIKKHLDVHILRYEQALFKLDQDNMGSELEKLKNEYAFFLGDNPATPQNISQLKGYINNNVHQHLFKEVNKQYSGLSKMEEEFESAFSIIKYHFPEAQFPKIYTAILGLYYERPIIYEDTVLVIALDMYLGANYSYYKRLGPAVPKYIVRRFAKEYIVTDCMKNLAFDYIKLKKMNNTLLDEMLTMGKCWMFAELALPDVPDTIISTYPAEKLQWAQQNEFNVWTYLIDKNYLYSKDNLLARKLVYEAPFTSYFGNASPGQIGAWLGWQICRAWITNNPDKPISELMYETDAQKILQESKYRPSKNI
ncbi:MAG: hypothetical protein WC142_05620 [Bacteroidales bacterium]|jgi:hypothetical protein|nr:hypothetical protein [Bacteroidales bacterium]MDD2687578.1 hypothetical protein [Bacteroidales bacterium]MDD3330227.1 hypothetical protein [Bacteroidales bacterium]MDD3691615.1 hypothetical protein [Bacteroidales bacterium]MDD4044442.1 hypothetical protein [Bacteroidales bacterium]